MRKIFTPIRSGLTLTILIFTIILILNTTVLAQTPASDSDKIQELKEKVAGRVEALKKEKLGGVSGVVKSSSDEVFILIQDGTQYSIQLDEDTKGLQIDTNLRKKEIKLSSIEKDTFVSIIGEIDKNEKTGMAKIVVRKDPNIVIIGKVASVSTKDGTITVESLDGKTYIIDIEVATKSNFYNPEKNTLSKIGLSKIEQGTKIHVYAIKGKEERLTALRVFILPKDLKVSVSPSPTSEVTPTAEVTLTPTPAKEE